MLIIDVKDGGIEKSLKIMKNKVRKTNLVKQLRDREVFDKPSVKKRKQKLKAIYVEKKFKSPENE